MQRVCENLMSVNGCKDANFGEGEFVSIETKSLGILPVYEILEMFRCRSCDIFHYKIKLTEAIEDTPLPLEFICPEQRLTRLESSRVC
ncbi:MAG: hypothetical protein NUV74_14070 [Candidatus Brocadiaceae bacterium]|nr:hypothetical protein [Candidatus Brocadiaceae bacterium]